MPSPELAPDPIEPTAPVAAAVPTAGRRRRTAGARRTPAQGRSPARRRDDGPLARAVAAALHGILAIDRTGGPAAHIQRCRIDALLREAVRRQEALGTSLAAVPAVTVACAHLLAGGVDDAHLALLDAGDLL